MTKKIMTAAFFVLLVFSASSGDLILLPDGGKPFLLNSPEGKYSIVPTEREWGSSLRIETEGKGTNVQVKAGELPNFNLKKRTLDLWVKGQALQNLKDFWIYASSDDAFENRVVYMISDDPTQLPEGQWVKISIPASAGKIWGSPDLTSLKYLQFWINDKGNGPVSLEIGPLIIEDQTQPGTAVITFDDGWVSQYELAAPILKRYRLNATAYIIPEKIGTEGYMTIPMVRSLKEEYQWSIGSHYMEPLDKWTEGELTQLFDSQKAWFKAQGFSLTDFAYPNGRVSADLLKAVPLYFSSARTIVDFRESLPPGYPYRIRVLNVVPGTSNEQIKARLDGARDNGELVVFVFHKITGTSNGETEISIDRFNDICRMIADSGIEVKTMADLSPLWSGSSQLADLPEKVSAAPAAQPEPVPTLQADKGGETAPGIQIDFGLDWKFVLGKRVTSGTYPADPAASPINTGSAGDYQFYNQLEDMYLYLQAPLFEGTIVYSAIGFSDVNFTNLSQINSDYNPLSLKHLYVEQKIGDFFTVKAGYYEPDPVNKWLQVTRSAGIEPAFGEDMAPTTLWLGGKAQFAGSWGLQFAFSPDFIGKGGSLTYQTELGVPNLFGSVWYQGETLTGETAAAINGDALKIASEAGLTVPLNTSTLHFSLGIKYLMSGTYSTYPDWDNVDSLRFSGGTSWTVPAGPFYLTPGAAYQLRIYPSGNTGHLAGLDFGLSYKALQWYTVFTCYNLAAPAWQDNTGLESGIIFDYRGIQYMTGYTMAGFNSLSGLYNNKDWNEGGLNGFFVRVKATYW